MRSSSTGIPAISVSATSRASPKTLTRRTTKRRRGSVSASGVPVVDRGGPGVAASQRDDLGEPFPLFIGDVVAVHRLPPTCFALISCTGQFLRHAHPFGPTMTRSARRSCRTSRHITSATGHRALPRARRNQRRTTVASVALTLVQTDAPSARPSSAAACGVISATRSGRLGRGDQDAQPAADGGDLPYGAGPDVAGAAAGPVAVHGRRLPER